MTRFMPRYAAYNAAIEELCKKVPGTSSVDTLDAPLRDPNHWNYAGMKLVAGRMLDRVAGLGFMPPAADATPAANQTSRRLSYTRDIQPILATHCFNCHGLDEHSREAGLRLDLRESAIAALDSGMRAIVPGKIAESELVPRITSTDADTVMPPPAFKKPLSPQQIELLQQWIAQGAGYEPHWAFQPVQRLAPAAEASREAWLRRVSLDLTGLPPTPDERAAFLADQSAGAHEQVVDRLLASPRHAERMALQWLDVARYADTNGYNNDEERTQWPWRDWVIDAFASNMPYDRFIVEQLAGDLLPDAGRQQRIATGFGRNHVLTTEGGIIPEEYRVEYVADRIQTAATAFMGLTLQCARCHDHKFDPISQRDYYRLFAFFNNIPDPPVAYASKKLVRVGEPTIALRNYADESELAALLAAKAELKAALPAKDAGKPEPTKAEADATAARLKQVEERIEAIDARTTRVMVMADLDTPRQAHVLNRGQYDQPRDTVEPGVPAWLPPLPAGVAANRLALARWLVDPRHPLTARVAVNRWWEMLFGRGLVETVEDFGAQGSPPTHPELLDHLASDLIEGGWNMRSILKSIVLSATYRQAAEAAPEAFVRDPDNRLLARGPRFRLPAEMVRDQALFAGGLLVERVGGPSVKPFQPAGLWEEVSVLHQATYVPDSGDGLHRRSLYTFWKRTCPPPALAVFDAPDRETCVIRRSRTSTPLQALVLMNDPTYVEAARGVALRAVALADRGSASTGDPARRDREIIAHACRLVLARDATPREIDLLLTKLNEFRRHFQGDAEAARRLVAINDAQDCPLPPDELAAWTVVGSTLLCLDETISKN
jgi:cytochrome c553